MGNGCYVSDKRPHLPHEADDICCYIRICHQHCIVVYYKRKRMPSGGGPGLQSRVGGNRIVPGGFDSHPFRYLL
jgi:hypothetical protein